MPNILQKWIYNLSAAAPLCLIFAVVWWFEKHSWCVPLICVCAFILLVATMEISFAYSKRNLPPIKINIEEVSPHDAWIVAYLISYAFPFASLALEDFNLYLSCAIALAIVLIAPFVNSATPNPLMFVKGYHFYQVKAKQGVSGYVLISKRKIRKANDLRHIKRIMEFLLLDEGGK